MYIVFEGIDGSGKTTMVEKVARWMFDKDIKLTLAREPLYGAEDYLLRYYIKCLDDLEDSDAFETLYYAMDRLINKTDIVKSLNDGRIVLSDRSYISSLMYQEDTDFVRNVNKYVIEPDLVIYFNVDTDVAFSRLKKRDGKISVSLEQLREYNEKYNDLFWGNAAKCLINNKNGNILTVNANNSVDEVFESIIYSLEEHYPEIFNKGED